MTNDPTTAAINKARHEGAIEALRSAAEHMSVGAAVGPIPIGVRPAVETWLCRLANQRLDRAKKEAAARLHEALAAPPATQAADGDRRGRWEARFRQYDAHDYANLATIGMALADEEQYGDDAVMAASFRRDGFGEDEIAGMMRPAAVPAAVEEQPDTGTPEAEAPVRCAAAVLRKPHGPHGWEPQPGMDPIRCPGFCCCDHPDDEHSVYGCADGCPCEYMPNLAAVAQPGKET